MYQRDITGKELMKKWFTIILSIMCLLVANTTAVMAQSNRTNPDVAKYYIKGNLSIEKGADGKTVYKLSQIDNSGIYFEDPYATRIGEETSLEDVQFQFSRARTDYPGGINTPLDFWRYDNSINEWQPDVETRQGTAGVEEKKSMVVMLVLDCSYSMGADFGQVQNDAISFIRSLCEASKGTGNIKLGIICFSKINETKIFKIRPLTETSFRQLSDSIRSIKPQNGTALYYAIDQAIDQMDKYCQNAIPSSEPLSAAYMVSFTDGLDQTSRNPDIDILTADNYYNKILADYGAKMQNKTFNGVHLQHEIRGVKGNDIISEGQLGKFERIGESLGNFKLLGNYSDLGREFDTIAKNLIDQWRILNLYVPNSFSGRVAWTYPGERVKPEPEPQPHPKSQPKATGRNVFLGLNFSVGMPLSMPYSFYFSDEYGRDGDWYYERDFGIGLCLKLGMDIAWPVSDKFAIGFYINGGANVSRYNWREYTPLFDDEYGRVIYNENDEIVYNIWDYGTTRAPGFDVKLGVLMLAGDLYSKPFIIGISPCLGFNLTNWDSFLPLEFRFGRVLGKHFYLTGNVNLGIPLYDTFVVEPSITLGWHFGEKIKMKK